MHVRSVCTLVQYSVISPDIVNIHEHATLERVPTTLFARRVRLLYILSCALLTTRLDYLLFQLTKPHLEVTWLKLTHGFCNFFVQYASPWTVPAFISYICKCFVMLSSWANPAWHLYLANHIDLWYTVESESWSKFKVKMNSFCTHNRFKAVKEKQTVCQKP